MKFATATVITLLSGICHAAPLSEEDRLILERAADDREYIPPPARIRPDFSYPSEEAPSYSVSDRKAAIMARMRPEEPQAVGRAHRRAPSARMAALMRQFQANDDDEPRSMSREISEVGGEDDSE